MSAAPISRPVDSALAYAARAWPVAPAHTIDARGACTCGNKQCESPGKHPRTQHGLKDATTDEVQIRQWWSRWPDANILVRTGMVGDRCLVVLDVDPRHNGDESLSTLEARHGMLPLTPRAITGSLGQHIWLWSAQPVPCSANRVGAGLDVRGEGGYVIVPPSKHASGREYVWDAGAHPDEVRLAEVPAWLLAAAGKGRKATTAPDASAYIEGGRNNALTSMAGAMRDKGFDREAIEAALLIENETKCRPALDPREVQRIAASVARYAPKNSPVSGDPWGLLSVAELAAPLPPVPWLVEGLGMAPGAVTLIGGYGFSGKTVAMQSLALSVAAGRPVWGVYGCRKGPVVHLDYEQGRRLTQERYQRLAVGQGIQLGDLAPGSLRVACLPRLYLDDDSAEAALEELAAGCALVIDDSFRASFPSADENDSKVRRHLDMLTRVSERTGAMMVVILHAKKPGKDDVAGAKFSLRGSSAIFDAAQSVYVFNGTKGAPTRVEHEKCRLRGKELPGWGLEVVDVEDRRGLLVRHLDGEQMEQDSGDALAEVKGQIIRMMGKVRRPMTTATAIYERIGGRKQQCLTAVREMLEDGDLVQSEGAEGVIVLGSRYGSRSA
jgi:hypothetical protein